MKTLAVASIEYALALYNSRTEIGGKEIRQLFGIKASAVVERLKKQAREEMLKNDVECWNKSAVDTECAYKAWNLDIVRLERMYTKLKKLGLSEVGQQSASDNKGCSK